MVLVLTEVGLLEDDRGLWAPADLLWQVGPGRWSLGRNQAGCAYPSLAGMSPLRSKHPPGPVTFSEPHFVWVMHLGVF